MTRLGSVLLALRGLMLVLLLLLDLLAPLSGQLRQRIRVPVSRVDYLALNGILDDFLQVLLYHTNFLWVFAFFKCALNEGHQLLRPLDLFLALVCVVARTLFRVAGELIFSSSAAALRLQPQLAVQIVVNLYGAAPLAPFLIPLGRLAYFKPKLC